MMPRRVKYPEPCSNVLGMPGAERRGYLFGKHFQMSSSHSQDGDIHAVH